MKGDDIPGCGRFDLYSFHNSNRRHLLQDILEYMKKYVGRCDHVRPRKKQEDWVQGGGGIQREEGLLKGEGVTSFRGEWDFFSVFRVDP